MDTISYKVTMQNTIGKMEYITACQGTCQRCRKQEVLPAIQDCFRLGACTCENVVKFAFNVHEGFQRKEQDLQ